MSETKTTMSPSGDAAGRDGTGSTSASSCTTDNDQHESKPPISSNDEEGERAPPPTAHGFANLESASLANGGPRVRFASDRRPGSFEATEDQWRPLAAALKLSEESGAAPVLPDGKIGGNGARLLDDGSMLVSRSGREAETDFTARDFVRVVAFDAAEWRASFDSADPSVKPSSDTPLLWRALVTAPSTCRAWKSAPSRPTFVLHGHSCASEEEALARGLPCSPKETLFSTPADTEALAEIFETHPWPDHNVFVRKNHGFFLLATSADEAINVFQAKILSPLPTITMTTETTKRDDDSKRKRAEHDANQNVVKDMNDDDGAKRGKTDDNDVKKDDITIGKNEEDVKAQ